MAGLAGVNRGGEVCIAKDHERVVDIAHQDWVEVALSLVLVARAVWEDRQAARSRAIGQGRFATGTCALTDMQDRDP